jgi:uncharacterized protein (TIGR03067 family)
MILKGNMILIYRRTIVTTAALCLPAVLFAAQEETAGPSAQQPEDERLERLVGEYQIVEAAKNGTSIPVERLKNNTVVFTRDTIAVVDPDRKELYSARYKIGPANDEGVVQVNMRSKSPKEGDAALGLLKLDKDRLWLIYGLSGERPTSFEKTTEGEHLFKMKRKTAKKQVAEEPTEP